MLEELARNAADGVTDHPAGQLGVGEPDGLEFLPDLIAALTAEGLDDRELVTQLATLETITCAAAAAKALLTQALHTQRRASDANAGLPTARRGRGVAHEVALARRESPWAARQHLTLALVLTKDMPDALAALRRGDLNEDKALILVRETTDLSAADRSRLDAALASRYASLSTKELTLATRRLAHQLDPTGAEERARRARERRHVTLHSIGDGMARITGQVPAQDAITAIQSLRDHATMRRKVGDDRTRDQLMADTFTDRLNQSLLPAAQTTASSNASGDGHDWAASVISDSGPS